MRQKIIIGSRGSELALWQANHIKREIEKKNKNVKVEINIIKTEEPKVKILEKMIFNGLSKASEEKKPMINELLLLLKDQIHHYSSETAL